MSGSLSRRLLQVAVSISALMAVVGGGVALVLGLDSLAASGVALSIDRTDPTWLSIDFPFRALAGIWFVVGLMFAYMVPSIEKHTVWFRFTCAAIFAMGVGRLFSVISLGAGSNPIFAIGLEFIIPPLLVVWQSKVARAGE